MLPTHIQEILNAVRRAVTRKEEAKKSRIQRIAEASLKFEIDK
jgi:hypothetical protein